MYPDASNGSLQFDLALVALESSLPAVSVAMRRQALGGQAAVDTDTPAIVVGFGVSTLAQRSDEGRKIFGIISVEAFPEATTDCERCDDRPCFVSDEAASVQVCQRDSGGPLYMRGVDDDAPLELVGIAIGFRSGVLCGSGSRFIRIDAPGVAVWLEHAIASNSAATSNGRRAGH